jgi:hypothetical protein
MAVANPIPFPTGTKDVLTRFSNYLYARRGMADSSVDLMTGFIRRAAPAIGLSPTQEDVEAYIAQMRRRGDSYANVSNITCTSAGRRSI